jgi:exodeoxyribonuclease V alpha subunit
MEEIQVLTPMRKTLVGVESLNRVLQNELNPKGRHKNEVMNGDTIFAWEIR